MKIDKPIEFDRVHRLGRYEFGRKNPRPIIVKSERFKDKEYVRQSTPEALYGTKYAVREQYPQEIEEKRKPLYPEAKEARQDKDNRVRLVCDKLYVNEQEVKITATNNENSFKAGSFSGKERETNRKWQSNTVYGRTVFSSTKINNPNSVKQKPSGLAWKIPSYSAVPLQNHFEMLSGLGESSADRDLSADRKSVKNKASSPIDRDITSKKQIAEDTIKVPHYV